MKVQCDRFKCMYVEKIKQTSLDLPNCFQILRSSVHSFTSSRLRLLHSSTSFIDTVCILKFPLLFTDLKWIWQEDKWDLNGETSVQKIYYVGEVMSSSRGCNNLEETAFFNQLYCCQTRTKIVALFSFIKRSAAFVCLEIQACLDFSSSFQY